jgi:5,10-methylenetetrahydromethanopterin reductase
MEVSLAFQTDKPLSAYGPLAQQVETYGFDGVTVYNDLLYQPAWLPLMEMARTTRRVRVGVAAVNPFTCHPINIAGHIALIDEAAQGRAYLGLARGSWLDFLGIAPARSVTALREAFGAIRHLLRQDKSPYRADIFPLAGGDTLRWALHRSEIPFLLGSWGAGAIRACLSEISEVKIGGTANPALIPHFCQIIADAQATSPQPVSPVGVVVGAVCVVDEDGAAARARARREVALYLPVVAQLDPTVQIEPELSARLRTAAAQYDYDAAAALISDALLARFAFAGAPDEVAAQASALFDAGVSRVEFGTPHGLSAEEGIRLLGARVLPALR